MAKRIKNKAGSETHNRKSQKGKARSLIKGKLSVAPSGYGFLMPEEEGPDVFIPAKNVGAAMHGDIVEVEITEDGIDGKGPAGRIVNIVTRSRRTLVGELIEGKKVRPLNKNLPEDIFINGSVHGAQKGDWVEVELIPHRMKDKIHKGLISRKLGHAGSIQADIDAVMAEFSLPLPYTDEQDEEASKLQPRKIDRADLSSLFCVTIDPHDAKDFDDAVSISGGKKGIVEVGVHIADVAAWIAPGSNWDREASFRSFTSYLPGKTLPMLPKSLTKLISLTPDKISLAHTVIISVKKDTGEIVGAKRCHSKIKITKRLTFEEVQSFIDGKTPEGWDDNFCSKMREIVDIALKMRINRKKVEKFLELSIPEVRVLCDFKKMEITGLERREQRQSDNLVEDCMLAANSKVAEELIEKSIPGLFRIHPEPDPEKFEDFYVFVSRTFGFSPGDLSSRTACNKFIEGLPNDHKKPIILGAFLRSLPRASYLEESQIHYGLGKFKYCHFTSPIRRYPDLLVHQQLWEFDTKGKLRSKKTVSKYAEDCSEKEENNDEAYFAATDRLKLKYLEQENSKAPDTLYEGLITKITSSGLVVDITQLGVFGFVPIEYLGGRFKYNKRESNLRGERGRQNYKCGDFIFLHLDRIDFIRGSAIFRPVR